MFGVPAFLPVISIIFLFQCVHAIMFKLEPSFGRGECITYRVPPGNLAQGFLIGAESDIHDIGVSIYGKDGSQPISLRRLTTKTPFSFLNGDKQNEYDVCFRAVPKPMAPGQPAPPPPTGKVYYKVGVELNYAPDWFDTKKAEEGKLNPVYYDFVASEQQTRQAASEISAYVKSEERLRDLNESSLERITWLSIISILSLVAIGVWQIYYLKSYFRTKKLI